MNDLELEFSSLTASMANEVEKMKSLYKEKYDLKHDVITDFVNNHKSNQHLTIDEKLNLVSKALLRQKVGIKPGLTDVDKSKDENDPFKSFGDYFIWNEVLHNFSDADSVIFISEENKNDYWENKEKITFDHILIEEFYEINTNKRLEGYHLIDFILKNKLNVSADTLFFINKVQLIETNNKEIELKNDIIIFKYNVELNGILEGSELQMHDEDLGDICEAITADFNVNANVTSYFKINHLLKKLEYYGSNIKFISDTFQATYNYVNYYDEILGE